MTIEEYREQMDLFTEEFIKLMQEEWSIYRSLDTVGDFRQKVENFKEEFGLPVRFNSKAINFLLGNDNLHYISNNTSWGNSTARLVKDYIPNLFGEDVDSKKILRIIANETTGDNYRLRAGFSNELGYRINFGDTVNSYMLFLYWIIYYAQEEIENKEIYSENSLKELSEEEIQQIIDIINSVVSVDLFDCCLPTCYQYLSDLVKIKNLPYEVYVCLFNNLINSYKGYRWHQSEIYDNVKYRGISIQAFCESHAITPNEAQILFNIKWNEEATGISNNMILGWLRENPSLKVTGITTNDIETVFGKNKNIQKLHGGKGIRFERNGIQPVEVLPELTVEKLEEQGADIEIVSKLNMDKLKTISHYLIERAGDTPAEKILLAAYIIAQLGYDRAINDISQDEIFQRN